MMWYWNGSWSWWGWLGMTLTMLIFWGLVIWGIVALVRYLNPPATREPSSPQRRPTPEAILALRFARGEIDEQEYSRKRDILLSPDRRPTEASNAGSDGAPFGHEIESVKALSLKPGTRNERS